MSITIKDVSKRFGAYQALKQVSLEVPSGALVALLGPSGSGKTTLLRIIAGLEAADEGSVLLHEQDAGALDARHRNIGFVFQHYALFRHMSVFDNIGFALRMRGRPREEIRARVLELLKLIQLEGIEKRYPAQLSGGQRQRVALARALAAKPQVLLLDEPFGALDAKVRKELRDWLRRLHDEIHVTSVFVTHDQEEALELADRVVVMSQGRVEQVGTPEDVYHRPANAFVMRFLGQVNLFHGRIHDGQVSLNAPALAGPKIVGYVRPHQLVITRERPAANAWQARITRLNAAGFQARVELQLLEDNTPVEVVLPLERFHELCLSTGDVVFVLPKEVKIFDAEAADYAI